MATLKNEIKRLNYSKKIKIRLNKLPEGFSLYLEHNHNYKRERYYLNTKISGKNTLTKRDKEILYEVEISRDLKEFELLGNNSSFALQKKVSEADFLEYLEITGKKKKLPSYQGTKKHLIIFINKKGSKDYLRFNEIDRNFCLKFKEYLIDLIDGDKLANQTAKTYMMVLSSCLNKAVSDHLIKVNPASKIRIKPIEAKREFLLEDELIRFLNTETRYIDIKNAFMFATQTSLRLGDIRALEFKDVRINNGKEAYLYFRQHKTKGVSYIKLSKLALSIYRDQKQLHPEKKKVFQLTASNSDLNTRIREIAKKAEINKHIHFHVSRHTFCTLALSKGVDIYTVSKIMHHSSVAITEIYANLVSKKRDEVADLINIEFF